MGTGTTTVETLDGRSWSNQAAPLQAGDPRLPSFTLRSPRRPRSRERSSFDDCSGLDRRSFQSVETRGREQVEVESRDGARGDHEGEHDRVIRPPQSCRVVVLEGSETIGTAAQGTLLASSGRGAAPTGLFCGGREPGLLVTGPSDGKEAEVHSRRRSKSRSAWRAIASTASPKPVSHENLSTW